MASEIYNIVVAMLRRGEQSSVLRILAEQPECCAVIDAGGMSLLHWSVVTEQSKVLEFLLAQSLVLLDTPQFSHNRTPLHLAAIKGNVELLRLLLEAGANVMVTDTNGLRPLDLASTPAAITALQPATLYPQRVLKEAIQAGVAMRVSRILVAQPTLCSATDSNGDTPLHWAVQTGNILVCEAVLAAGVAIMHPNILGDSVLHLAARKGDASLINVLLAVGADVNTAAHQGITPLHIVCGHGDATQSIFPPPPVGISASPVSTNTGMMNQGTFDFDTPTITPKHTKTPSLSGRDDVAIATALIDAGADVSRCASGGVTALHLAVHLGDTALVTLLLAHGAARDAELTLWRSTPLHIAAWHKNAQLIHLLLLAGANTDICDGYGRSVTDLLTMPHN